MKKGERQCQWCGKEHRGIGTSYIGGAKRFCSIACRDLYNAKEKGQAMPDFTTLEKEAMQYAGRMAGEYLQSIGKYNLVELSKDEWQTFLEVYTYNYHDFLASKKIIDDEIQY